VLAAEMQMLVAAQRDERLRAMCAIDGNLSAQLASATAAVIARFADRRAALLQLTNPDARAAAAGRCAIEETAELASLAVAHAAEKRRLKQAVASSLASIHRAARRSLRQCQRHQRMGMAVRLQTLRARMPRPARRVPVLRTRAAARWRRPPNSA